MLPLLRTYKTCFQAEAGNKLTTSERSSPPYVALVQLVICGGSEHGFLFADATRSAICGPKLNDPVRGSCTQHPKTPLAAFHSSPRLSGFLCYYAVLDVTESLTRLLLYFFPCPTEEGNFSAPLNIRVTSCLAPREEKSMHTAVPERWSRQLDELGLFKPQDT